MNSHGRNSRNEMVAIAEKTIMVPDLNQSSIWPRSSTTSRQPSVMAISRNPTQSTLSPPARRSRRSRSSTSGSSTNQCTREIVGDPAAECRSYRRRDDHGDAVESKSLAAFLRREGVGEDGLLAGWHAAAAESLQDAKENQRTQARCQSAKQ